MYKYQFKEGDGRILYHGWIIWASLSELHTSVFGGTISLYIHTYFCLYAHTANMRQISHVYHMLYSRAHSR